jgi:hypothetical protein
MYEHRDPRFHCGWSCHCHLGYLMPKLLFSVISERCHEGHNWGGKVWTHPSCSLWLPFLRLLVRICAAPIISGMSFISFRQLAVPACWCGRCFFLFRTLLACGSSHTTNNGEVACSLSKRTVMALRETILSFIGLYPDWDVVNAWQSENFWGLCRPM